nr:DUF4142 domain-containing protein [Chitinasiproducens palmae]
MLSGVAMAQDNPQVGSPSLSAVDQKFVEVATQSSSTEIDTAKLALKQSSDKDVKSFARHMIVDHTKLTVQLKAAAPKGVKVPKDNTDPAVIQALQGLKGKAFDEAYIKQVGIEGHQKAVAAFREEANTGNNADLKKAAQKALPTIEGHLKMAQDLAAKKGVAQ